jgi:TolB-like protein
VRGAVFVTDGPLIPIRITVSDTISRLSAALAGRYRLRREIGSGGMATVYSAHDVKHSREVAVKVLRPELAAVLGAQRFLQEIQVTANLQHPHILPLYDSGEADGQLFYVMPLVRGESLRARLAREKQLPVGEALSIARQVAGALDFAHRLGVVHRDIKPENILMHEGEAMLADFGIALAVTEAGGDRLTQTGLSMGTPSYMSPEQATGEREITAKADIYSLGAVTYEMLAGEPPVTGPSARAMIAKLLTGQVTPLTVVRDSVPAEVNAAVMRALAKEPVDRPATAKEFGDGLKAAPAATSTAQVPATAPAAVGSSRGRRLFAAAMMVSAIAALVTAVAKLNKGGASSASRSIAVLPFVDRGGDSSAFLGDGIAETLIYALGKVPGLKVAAQTSAFSYKGKTVDLADIGSKLGVATVLTGSVQRAGSKLRVTVRLEDVESHAELWTDQYDREMSDVFALQDDIARAVVTRLQATATTATIVNAGTQSVPAYEAFMQGRFLLSQRGSGVLASIAQFQRAIGLDSNYAQAWSGLAQALMVMRTYGAVSDTIVPHFERALNRALALDSMSAPARAANAFWLHSYHRDLDAAEREYRRTLELDSTYAMGRSWYAVFLAGARLRFDEAIVEARRAVASDPLSGHVANQMAAVLVRSQDTTAVLTEARRALSLIPNWQNYRLIARALVRVNRRREALAVYDTAVALSGGNYWVVGEQAALLMFVGDSIRANAIRERVLARPRGERGRAWVLATIATWNGDDAAAVRWLDEAKAEREPLLSWPALGKDLLPVLGRRMPPGVQAFWESMGLPKSYFESQQP